MGKFKLPLGAELLGNSPSTVVRPRGRLVGDVDSMCLRFHDGVRPGGFPIGVSNISFVTVTDYMSAEDAEACMAMEVLHLSLELPDEAYDLPDVSAAFNTAMAASRFVYCPPGLFRCDAIRFQTGVTLLGSGAGASGIIQVDPDRPAVHVLSDADVGQLINVNFTGFTVYGCPDATVAAVKVECDVPYAITRSHFDYFALRSFGALEIDSPGSVYDCKFDITSNFTSDIAVLDGGSNYCKFNIFATNCDDYALTSASFNSRVKITCDSCIKVTGQVCTIEPTIEGITPAVAPSQTVIEDLGFNNIYLNPTIGLLTSGADKITYGFFPLYGTIYINPQILGEVPHPFRSNNNYPVTMINGRAGQILNKMEVLYDDSDAQHSLSMFTFVGDVSDYTDKSSNPGAAVIQREDSLGDDTPSGPFNFVIESGTTDVVLTPTQFIDNGAVDPAANFSFSGGAPFDGRTIHFSTTYGIRKIGWPPVDPGKYALLPTALSENGSFTIVWSEDDDKWYPRDQVDNGWTATKAIDPPNIANGASYSTTVALFGALLGAKQMVDASFSLSLQGLGLTASIDADAAVTITLVNNTGAAVNLGNGTMTVKVMNVGTPAYISKVN